MSEEFKVPKFKYESEEAQWWNSQDKNPTLAFGPPTYIPS